MSLGVSKVEKGVCFNCKKFFDSGIEIDFNKKFFNNYKLCLSCAKSLFLGLSQEFVPKGIKNKICDYKVLEDK